MKTLRALGVTIANTYKLLGRSDWKFEITPIKKKVKLKLVNLMKRLESRDEEW